MKYHSISNKRLIAILLSLVMIFSLVACGGGGGGASENGPMGTFENTLMDEDDGEGFQPVDEFGGFGSMSFNSDGTGKWEYALDTEIEWTLKGDKLTIVEKWEDDEYGEQEEKYTASWDGEKEEFTLDVWGFKYLFVKADDAAATEDSETTEEVAAAPAAPVDSDLAGSYECVRVEMHGDDFGVSGEWLKLNADGTGEWYLGIMEETFTWKEDAGEIHFDIDVDNSENKMKYTATIDGEEIMVDTGLQYFFVKDGEAATEGATQKPIAPAEDNVATGYVGWGLKPAGSITVPQDWYGVVQITDAEGFDFEEIEYDVWGYTDEDSSGNAYFELWLDPDLQSHPIMSFYIDRNETAWLTPVIGEDDAWVNIDGSDSEQTLTEDHEWAIMSQYIDGALDIYHGYFDDEGRFADCRFFVREIGMGWHEDSDPLPPGYEDYKAEHSHITVD